jgi:hypothetical protein
LILRFIITRIAVFRDLSWFDIHICNYLSLSKDRKMSLWPLTLKINIHTISTINIYKFDWNPLKNTSFGVNKALKEIKNITGPWHFDLWHKKYDKLLAFYMVNVLTKFDRNKLKKAMLCPLGYIWVILKKCL